MTIARFIRAGPPPSAPRNPAVPNRGGEPTGLPSQAQDATMDSPSACGGQASDRLASCEPGPSWCCTRAQRSAVDG